MAARDFNQILAEVSAKSDPQRKIVLDQVANLPTQQAADESALGARKDQAYEDIVTGARRRGLGFSGIPLGEQAKYAATDYAPALANLKSNYVTQRGTLESALADIGRSDYMDAQDLFDRDRAFDEQQRQFNEQMAAQRRAEAAAKATLNTAAKVDPVQQDAFDEVQERIRGGDVNSIMSDYMATLRSANFGNARDKYKIASYDKYRPDIAAEARKRMQSAAAFTSLPGLTIMGNQSGISGLPAGVKF
jgi:hypothetical protein